jgi:hypothetical protein
MSRRLLPAGMVAAGAALVACFELSSPPAGLSAISPIEAAWPSVVIGETLRDSTGAVVPLRVEAFDGDGNVVTDATVLFIALDRGLRVDPDGVVHGDSVRTSPVRVVAQVRRGGDVLQSPQLTLDVVPRPDSVSPAHRDTLDPKTFQLADAAPVTSDPLTVTVLSRTAGGSAAAPVRSWIVRYEITGAPVGVNGQRTAFFTGRGSATVAIDTTDASGVANGLTIVFHQALLPTRFGLHHVEVQATVRERGSHLAGSPVNLVVPFQGPQQSP